MTDKPGKNIDDIFREKLLEGENYVEYGEADWTALEKRLDAKAQPFVPWIRILSAAAAILIVVIFAWIIWKPSDNGNKSITQSELPPPTHPVTPESGNHPSSESPNSLSGSNSNQPTEAPVAALPKKGRASTSRKNEKQESKVTIGKHPLSNPPMLAENSIPVTFNNITNSNKQVSVSPERSGVKPLTNGIKRTPVWNGLALGIIASTDLNGVGTFQNSSVGGDFGLIVTARVMNRWSLSTGAIYAKKPYTIPYSQYRPTSNYRQLVQPDKVHADCRVLDIPVNISYIFWKRKNDSFSLGAGISSYLMLRENYYFRYANSYNHGSNELSIVYQNRHWFGVVNLQVSYERQISSDLSIGFEPYIKLPVDNIGYGRVKLQSAGLAVKVNWNIWQ